MTGDPFRITCHQQVREAHNIVQHIQGLHGKHNKVPRNHDKAQPVTGDPFRVTCHWQPREARNVSIIPLSLTLLLPSICNPKFSLGPHACVIIIIIIVIIILSYYISLLLYDYMIISVAILPQAILAQGKLRLVRASI